MGELGFESKTVETKLQILNYNILIPNVNISPLSVGLAVEADSLISDMVP